MISRKLHSFIRQDLCSIFREIACYYPLLERICTHRKGNTPPNWRT
nr:MAG TPA: hypothetical protein [Caudoviricetes sp.]